MRGESPGLFRFFLDLFILAAVVPALAFGINFFVSGIGPYNFTVEQILKNFLFHYNALLIQLSPFIDTFYVFSLVFALFLLVATSIWSPRGKIQ